MNMRDAVACRRPRPCPYSRPRPASHIDAGHAGRGRNQPRPDAVGRGDAVTRSEEAPMKTYSRHNCSSAHRTYKKFAECAIRRVEWVEGEGPIALIAWCRVPTVTLHETMESAESAKRSIDETACGGFCVRNHEIVRLNCPSAVR